MRKTFVPFFYCLLFASVVLHKAAIAADLPIIGNPIKGNQIVKGANNYIDLQQSAVYSNLVTPVNRITNIISFSLREDTAMFLQSNFIAKLRYRLYFKNAAGTLDSLINQWLEISYDSSSANKYNQRKSFYFYNAPYTKILVDSFYTNVAWNVKPALILMNEMRVNADYQFNCVANVVSSLDKNIALSQQDELHVAWNKPAGADEFDLEWSYIDSSALDNYKTNNNYDPLLIFDNNATRISTADSLNYKIPLLYDYGGILFYRVRPVQNKLNGKRIEGAWTTNTNGAGNSWYYPYAGHQRPLNWQATTSFAEEGKRKSVVQYFDGTLRSRQTVTKDNTSGKTVVAETFYDHQGRPVIQVLPAPTLSNIIAYTQNFNRMNTGEYDKSRYDTLLNPSAYCNTSADTLSVLSGASRYYSTSNPEKNTSFNKFIPDAKGYPFTETQYTQDNTGRISKQSGVGPDHRMGSGHETKYFYGTASQRELDALFGTEVGNYSHYFKNMVRDANGQYSVSYVDMKGRTIATALAGKLNDTLQLNSLPTYDSVRITEKLTDASSNTVKGLSMEASKGLVVTKSGVHQFQYSLLPDSVRIQTCSTSNICYDCYYDLEITISGDCNNQQFGGQVARVIRKNLTIDPPDTLCNIISPFPSVDTSIFLTEGTYLVTKKLTISKFAADYYRDSVFLKKNTCKTKEQFIQEQLDSIRAQTQCELTCAACTTNLGTWTSYRHKYMLESGYPFSDTAMHRNEAWSAYQEEMENCNELCGNTGLDEDIRHTMLADMSPPSGQYADTSLIDPVSIYSTDPVSGYIRFQNPGLIYLDENGKKDSVRTIVNGEEKLVPPNELPIYEFIDNFKSSWAETLLPYHPEYCYLTKYEQFKASHLWDRRFLSVETFKAAKDSGFINPISSTTYPLYNAGFNQDPLSTSGATYYDEVNNVTVDAWDALHAWMTNYRSNPNSGSGGNINIWQMAAFTANRQNAILTNPHPFDTTLLCKGEIDMAWKSFRELYYKEKLKLLYKLQKHECGNNPSDDLFVIMKKHTLRFRDPSFDYTNSTYTNASDEAAAKQRIKDSLSVSYVNNCKAYAEQWLLQLTQCPQYDTANIRAEALPHLINVCIKGSDEWHPYGSSSISPDSSYTFNSFQDVMNWYNANHNVNDTAQCNAYIITNPPAYGKQGSFADKPFWSKPDSCDCATIINLYNNYTANQSSYTSFSNYLFRKHGTVITNGALDTLRNLCNGTITCNFLTAPIMLPPAMHCGVKDVCVNCITVDTTYQRFKILYPTIKPLYEDGQDTTQQKKNKLFANFMNNRLGFSFTHVDYLQFLDSCKPGGSGSFTSRDSLARIAFDFKNQFYAQADSVSLDSSGCNVAYWRMNWYGVHGGAYAHDMKYKMSDYRKNGIWKKLLRDSSEFTLPLNYFPAKPICMKNGFSLEIRMRFPMDSIDNAMHTRAVARYNGSTFWPAYYGRVSLTTAFLTPGDTAFYTVNGMKENYNAPQPNSYMVVYNPPGSPTQTYTAFNREPDPALLMPTGQFATYRWKYRNDTCWLYRDGVLVSTTVVPGLRYDRFTTFRINSHGLNFEMDHIKMYGANDVLEFSDDFSTPCTPPEPVRIANCTNTPCDTAFKNYFNQVKGTAYTYQQILQVYQSVCGYVPNFCTPPNNDKMLCGKSAPVFFPIDTIVSVCEDSTSMAYIKGTVLYEAYVDSIKNSFEDKYLSKCLEAYKYESFTVTRPVSEFHYTLYYYDQAGNLVKTVPPAGVKPIYRQTWLDSVNNFRNNKQTLLPAHTLATTYRYNTLNQVVAQKTPDAGVSNFWYDRLGRLAISQNAKQFAQTTKNYSYTLYDLLGRITEVGQKPQTTAMTNAISRNQTQLQNWLANIGFLKQQITRTVYDTAIVNTGVTANIIQRNVRNRVSYTTYTDLEYDPAAPGMGDPGWNSAVFYSYDIHGNVDTLLNDYGSSLYTQTQNPMNLRGHRWKKMVYRYDLISRKVNHVAYQPGKRDALYHRYGYDAENRLVVAETSTDSLYWERDARYSYYRHGPMARTVLGELKVQGLDYAYTLQGWLKGVNGTVTNPVYDMGGDGTPLSGGTEGGVARDTFGFALYYHGNDYTAINDVNRFAGLRAKLVTANAHRPLFNGNISAMAVNIGPLNSPMLYNYTYDQLNRLVAMDAFTGTNTGANLWSGTLTGTAAYQERIGYDANGNILQYKRNGSVAQTVMDSLNYKYYAGTNKLNHVRDNSAAGNYTNFAPAGRNVIDIDNQLANNYLYDEIGNLIRDSSEAIRTSVGGIKWNVYGKITEINKTDSTATSFNIGRFRKISYYYDAAGNRVGAKHERYASRPTYWTWYVRDASGNVMGTYSYTDSLRLTEQYIYGSSRAGSINPNLNLERPIPAVDIVNMPLLSGTGNFISFTRGNKFFELSNHLGNVLVTLSDKKKGIQNGTTGTVAYYLPVVKSAQDYYPFGMKMPGRIFNAAAGYRYGFNGKEEDDEVKGDGNQQDYEMRIYDPRLGRFLSVDPLTSEFPWQSPFVFADNNPIALIDFKGMSGEPPTLQNVGKSFLKHIKVWSLRISTIRLAASALSVKYKVKADKEYNAYKKFMNKMENKYKRGSCDDCYGGGGAGGDFGSKEGGKSEADKKHFKINLKEFIVRLDMSEEEIATADKLLSRANKYEETSQNFMGVSQALGQLTPAGATLEVIKSAYKEIKKRYDESKKKKEFDVDKEVAHMLDEYLKKQEKKVEDAADKAQPGGSK